MTTKWAKLFSKTRWAITGNFFIFSISPDTPKAFNPTLVDALIIFKALVPFSVEPTILLTFSYDISIPW